jgi:siroheme synthase (precorrin-2 oxidase/ferrochelatase)
MSRRPVLPVSLLVSGRRALVAGDGAGADERAFRLRAAGADVVRVARDDYRPEQCCDAWLVVAQDADPAFNRRVAADARAAGCLTYAHDLPAHSDLAMPAVARRGPLQLAISTGGIAPALARRLREELDRLLAASGAALDELLRTLERQRAELPGARRGELYQLARRLTVRGDIVIADEPAAAASPEPTDPD